VSRTYSSPRVDGKKTFKRILKAWGVRKGVNWIEGAQDMMQRLAVANTVLILRNIIIYFMTFNIIFETRRCKRIMKLVYFELLSAHVFRHI
jgi:uncharacterized membrane protein YozB (DUF420 family)